MAEKKSNGDEHICHRDKEIFDLGVKITETHKIVVGNGTPEKGLYSQVIVMNERQEGIKKDIGDIKDTIKLMDKKYDESIEASKKALNAVSRLRDEDNIIDREKTKAKAKSKTIMERWYQIIAVIISILGLLIAFNKRTNDLERRVQDGFDNMGTPYVMNKRGMVPLPDSSQIKFWPNDSLTYTIIRMK